MSSYSRRVPDLPTPSSSAGLSSMRGNDIQATRSRSKASSPAPEAATGTASTGKLVEESEEKSPDRKRSRPPPPGLRQTFAPGRWLNDDSISFAYTRLEQNADNDSSMGSKLSEAVLLIDPPT